VSWEPPADIQAEQYVLSAMMASRQAISEAVEITEPSHFYRPAHQVLFEVMVSMFTRNVRIDPLTLRHEVEREAADLKALGGQARAAEYILELFGLPVNPSSVIHYAKLVLAAALRRTLGEVAAALERDSRAPTSDPAEILATLDERMETLRRGITLNPQRASDFQSVTAGVLRDHHPVAEGLLDEQERVVVVGGEGRGKTTMLHQIAFTVAAGVHPFAWQHRIPPRRVFIADFENPPPELSRRFGKLGEAADQYGWDPAMADFFLRPGGICLSNAREAFELMDAIRRHEPALVVAGPIYKLVDAMTARGMDALQAHARVAMFFDQIRQQFGSAIMLETHAPWGAAGKTREMRPEGSNVWVKWPEFRFALYRGTKLQGGDNGLGLKRYGGDRIAGRVWPSFLTRNQMYPASGWPWTAGYDKGVLDTPMSWDEEDPGDGG
jgi:DnaB-like helicase N terminal domain/AAA domain